MKDRSQRVETDVNVYRLRLTALADGVVFGWDYPGSTLLRVRIVRAAVGAADSDAEAAAPSRPPPPRPRARR